MKYDFILFENLYDVENHYKDLRILIALLKQAGYKVAVVDAFKEADLGIVEDVPHIPIQLKCPNEFHSLQKYKKMRSGWKNLYYRIFKDIYLYRLIKKIRGLAPNVYLGSMTMATPAFFFRAFDKNTNYYMWALRSANVLYWRNNGLGLYHFVSKALFNNIKKYHNLRLIVSNEIIKKEFEKEVGVLSERLILRPERVISNKVIPHTKKKLSGELHLLYIGTIRPSKNIEFCLDAIEKLNDNRIKYTIAGRSREDIVYGEKINCMARKLPNVDRVDRYIPDEEYERLINDCDYMIFCDKIEDSCASNGTMTEALLQGKPIIAPDNNPFRFEVEKYGVGYLYEYGNVDSLCEVLKLALKEDSYTFCDAIANYQDLFILNNVACSLKKQIEKNII